MRRSTCLERSGDTACTTASGLLINLGPTGTVAAPPRTRAPTRLAIAVLVDHDSPRTGPLDEAHVSGLADVVTEMPPVLVHRETLRIIDGRHRVSAAERRGATHVRVEFFEGSAEEAFVEAVRRNARHGLPLTLEQRRAAALRILASHPHWSDGVIADHSCLSASTVAGLRRCGGIEPALVRRGRDGRTRPVDGASRRRLVERFFIEHPNGSLRQAAEAADVSPSTAKLVRDAMRSPSGPSRVVALRAGRAGTSVDELIPLAPEDVSPAATSAGEPADLSSSELLQRLSRDPSVRAGEDGRAMLRALLVCFALTISPERVPAHRRDLAALLARRCAVRWSALASSLERSR